MKNWCIVILTMLIVSGCEETGVVIPEYVPPDSDKVVLIEELTGVSCPNCPAGSSELKGIQQRFGDNVAVVSIHTNFLGTPKSNSKYDFRTQKGNEIEDILGLYLGKPAASFDRIHFPGETYRPISNVGTWSGYVASQLEDFAPLIIRAEHKYSEDTRELDMSFEIESKELMEGDFRLTVYLLESGIIDPQENQTGIIEDYEHNNALREVLSSVQGDVVGNELDPLNILSRSFSYTLPPEDGWWVAGNCSVIAFVSDQSKENLVLQAVKFNLEID